MDEFGIFVLFQNHFEGMKHITENKSTRLFIILGGFFVANALIAEFIGVKIFQLETTFGFLPFEYTLLGEKVSFQYTAGVLLWPVVFVMTDIINEYYGKKGVRFLSFLAVGLISYAFFMVYLAIALAPAAWWVGSKESIGIPDLQAAFQGIFGQGLLIILGSLVAFLIGQIVDVWVFQKIRTKTGEGKVWVRATGSTLVSQFIDSFVVLSIAFYFGPMLFPSYGTPWTFALLLAVGLNNYCYKFLMAVVLTPVIYFAHSRIDNYLGKEKAQELKEKAGM